MPVSRKMAQLRNLMLLCSLSFCIESHIFYSAETLSTLNKGQQMTDFEYLLSENGIFKLGFFNPGSSSKLGPSSNRYLGIWYNKLPNHPDAVWVANPKDPVVNSSGTLLLDSDGRLKITNHEQQAILVASNLASSGNLTATLLDTGNFVLRAADKNGTPGHVLWQSFDYPTNTLLPGMKLGMNLKTGHKWILTSWLSDQVPAPGAFRLGVDQGGANQLVVWHREDVYWIGGTWETGNSTTVADPKRAELYRYTFVSDENEKYFIYSVKNSSTISRWELNGWGQILMFVLASDGTTWQQYTTVGPPCKFTMNFPDTVCTEQEFSECRNDSELFRPVKGYFSPSTSKHLREDTNLALSDCHATCWGYCSCVGYKSLYPNGTGCEFWSQESHFITYEDVEDTYILTLGNHKEVTSTEGGMKRRTRHKWWIWCTVTIIPTLVLLLLGFFCYTRRRRQRFLPHIGLTERNKTPAFLNLRLQTIPLHGCSKAYQQKHGNRNGNKFQLLSVSQVVAATDDFSAANKLGEGGFGPVYKGILQDGQQVAVKRLARNSGQGQEEFINEITVIAQLQHMNLVNLLGCCIQGEEKMLIYEYMTNKSLDFFLFDPHKRKLLDWKRRVDIIEGIAQGILYLHKYSRLRIIHRDLKTSNILLDENMKPKISDFGMARIFGHNESRAKTTRVVGTYGYMSPEYAMKGIFSEKSDVYSFGVLLLEIMSGEKNRVFSSSSSFSLIEHTWNLWKRGSTHELMDQSLVSSCPKDELLRFIHIGLLCLQESAVDRPTMSEILSMLTNGVVVLPHPNDPAYSNGKSEIKNELPDGRLDLYSVNHVSITSMEAR